MPLKSHEARKLALASVAALAVLGASASAADAAKLSLTYQCNYPLIGEQPLKIDIDAAIPSSTPVGVATPEFAINAVATASGNTYDGLSLIGAKKLQGTSLANSTVNLPGGLALPVAVPITIAPYDVPATKGNLVLNASGKTSSLTFTQPGNATITVDKLSLNLKALKADGTAVVFPGSDSDSDKDASTFDVACRLDPTSQSTLLTTITIGDGPIVTTPPVTPPATTPPVTPPATTPPVTPPATTPPPTGGFVNYGYTIKGTSNLKTFTQGPVPITGDIDAKLQLSTGDYTGDLRLNRTKAKLTVLGILPVTADIAFESIGQVSGSLKNGVLTANQKLKIKLPQLYLFGAIPIAGSGTCQTKQASNIALRSTDKFFQPLEGGTLVGSYSISDLGGCGALNGFISPLAAGSGNTIAVKLTPKS